MSIVVEVPLYVEPSDGSFRRRTQAELDAAIKRRLAVINAMKPK